jgi:hypothetical protein
MLRPDQSALSSLFPLLLRHPSLLGAFLLAALAVGCTPKIGDECTTSTNCSASGDRLCDITQPGGYCTVFNCEPDSCPEDSVCINFGTQLSSLPQCSVSQGNSPYQRSFCLATCAKDGDCRGGYNCLPAEQLHAVIADNRVSKVCAVAPGPGPDPNAGSGVCTGDPDAGPPLSDTSAGGGNGTNAGGDSGAAGAPGAAGSNEAGAGG